MVSVIGMWYDFIIGSFVTLRANKMLPLSQPSMFSYNDMLYLLSFKKCNGMAKGYALLISCL